MKIADHNTIAPLTKVGSRSEQTEHAIQVDLPRGEADRVSLSQEILERRQADMDRVEAIAKLIAEGNYQLDLERLAEAIVLKELL